MPIRGHMRITAAVLALAIGLTGAAQAEPFNIFSVSKAAERAEGTAPQLDQVRYRHRGRGINPGAAFALGTMGLIAGAAVASSNRRYYCDPYYEYCGPRRRVYSYYDGGYYDGPRYYRSNRNHRYHDGRRYRSSSQWRGRVYGGNN